jgi:ribosomal protein L37AE/L43A
MINYSKNRFLKLIKEQTITVSGDVHEDADEGMAEHDDKTDCPSCGGEAHLMGRLGNLKHYKCRACGAEVSKELDENRWAMDEEADCGPGMYEETMPTEETDTENLDEHCGCEEEEAHEDACPLCGSVLMHGECEHHGHMMNAPMAIETVVESKRMLRLAGLLKEDISGEETEDKEATASDANSKKRAKLRLPTPEEEKEDMNECDMSASREFGGLWGGDLD